MVQVGYTPQFDLYYASYYVKTLHPGLQFIFVKPGNKNQMLGTHIGFEINMVKFS